MIFCVLNADSLGEFSTQTEYCCYVVSVPAYLGHSKFEFSMECNDTDYYYYSIPRFFQANAVIVP
jgi:hypothetical protein